MSMSLIPTSQSEVALRERMLRAICNDECPDCERPITEHTAFQASALIDPRCQRYREEIYRLFVRFLTGRWNPKWGTYQL